MSESEAVKRVDAGGLAPEALPDLSDFYEEPQSANITPGWYAATVLPGFATQRGTQFQTGDTPSDKGDGRRKMTFCFGLQVGAQVFNRQRSFFYNPEQFTAQGLAALKGMREQFKGVKSWPGQGHAQNASITLGELAQLERAIGFKLQPHPAGGFVVAPYAGKKLDVRVSTGKKRFDELTGFAPAGTRSSKK